MSLFVATILTSLVLLTCGSLLVWNGPAIGALARRFPRSRRAAFVTMGLGAAWTLYRITQLGEADFGNYRVQIFLGFAVLTVLAFRYVPDFLSVRGMSVVILLLADVLLTAAYMHYEEPARLFLVGFVYAMIILALYLAVSPFRLRDFFQWVFTRPIRARTVGVIVGLYGLVLVSAALTYT